MGWEKQLRAIGIQRSLFLPDDGGVSESIIHSVEKTAVDEIINEWFRFYENQLVLYPIGLANKHKAMNNSIRFFINI
jgi:hypothetical protein